MAWFCPAKLITRNKGNGKSKQSNVHIWSDNPDETYWAVVIEKWIDFELQMHLTDPSNRFELSKVDRTDLFIF